MPCLSLLYINVKSIKFMPQDLLLRGKSAAARDSKLTFLRVIMSGSKNTAEIFLK